MGLKQLPSCLLFICTFMWCLC